MARILDKGKGFVLLYKEAGEDSEKIAPPGTGILYRLDMPVQGIVAAAAPDSGFEIISKKYFLICSGRLEDESGSMQDLLFHDSVSNRTFPVKKIRKGVKEAKLRYEVSDYNAEEDLSFVHAGAGVDSDPARGRSGAASGDARRGVFDILRQADLEEKGRWLRVSHRMDSAGRLCGSARPRPGRHESP